MPKISVIIPCFNQAEFLEECINSVLQQTTDDFEIIVVDDGSTTESSKKILDNLQKPKTKIIRQINMGAPQARNTGVRNASGKYILPLDSDDKIAPDFLKKCSDYMDKHPNCGICGGLTEFFGDKTGVWNLPKYSFPEILSGNCMVCTHMYRRNDWEKVGGYNKNMKYGLEDWDFWLSIIELGREVHQFDDVLFYYRKHGKDTVSGNLSKRPQRHLLMLKQIIENHIQTYNKYPKIKRHLLYRESAIHKFLLRVLCMFIPVRDWRHKIKDYFNK